MNDDICQKGCLMNQYTALLEQKVETLSPEDDDYKESLLEIASFFRGFDETFTSFIVEHGYTDDPGNVEKKAKFLRNKYKEAGIKLPRDFKEWFIPKKRLKRDSVFPICFAFGLNVDETNDFFRCIQFERSFDCHTINEAVYYFCIKNGLTYGQAQEMIGRIPKANKVKALPDHKILYTGTIVEYINSIDEKEKLIRYITDNISDFEYNNATAIKYIQEHWNEISKENGLAVQEGMIIDKEKNHFQDKTKKGDVDIRPKEIVAKEVNRQTEIKHDDFVIAKDGASTWTIFSQIIGLDNKTESRYAVKYDRSLSSILNRSVLLPLNASYCFPSQHNIDKLIRGDMSDHEMIRKMLIFLVFYTYWVKKIIKNHDAFYFATSADSAGCLASIDNYLLDAGYPQLYAGNPYDWLFKWALNDKHPLEAFRYYIGEIFAIDSECNCKTNI